MPSDKVYILEYDGITIHLTPASLQNHSLHLGSSSAAVHHHDPKKGQTVYHISISVSLSSPGSLLIRYSSRHTRRPKLPTAPSISQYTRRNCAIHIPIYSRYLKERSFPTPTINGSASSNQTAPQPWSPKRRRRAVTVTKEHLLCSRYDCSCRQIPTDLSDTIACESSRE